MAVIGINYDGGGFVYDENNEPTELMYPIEYKLVYLSTQSEKFEFNSGNFIVDWYHAIKKFYNEVDDIHLSHSSTVNHFIMDGAPYSSAYLFWENDLPILKYLKEGWADSIESMLEAKQIYDNGGIEMFVEDGIKPTFEELKNYVENNS
jgi:hypothetical protein